MRVTTNKKSSYRHSMKCNKLYNTFTLNEANLVSVICNQYFSTSQSLYFIDILFLNCIMQNILCETIIKKLSTVYIYTVLPVNRVSEHPLRKHVALANAAAPDAQFLTALSVSLCLSGVSLYIFSIFKKILWYEHETKICNTQYDNSRKAVIRLIYNFSRLMFTMTPHLETSIFASYYRQQTMLLIYIWRQNQPEM